MEEQHPIPQQISSYQFRLVGDMTLKQFMQLAGGGIVSLLFYASPLNPFIKWPLIILSFLFGIALAFMPIEDRPLSTWIFIFFRAIYSPTYFVWKKTDFTKLLFLPEEQVKTPLPKVAEEVQKPTLVTQGPAVTKLEEKEESLLKKISQHLIAPNTSVAVGMGDVSIVTPPPAVAMPIQIQQTVPQRKAQEEKNINIPQVITPKIEPVPRTPVFPTPTVVQPMTSSTVAPNIIQKPEWPTKQAQFNPSVAPPSPSSKANVVVGQVLDAEGKIVVGAILEIKDADGRPVRALKSNSLGHFMIATPLLNGKYEIITEKDGLTFENLSFDAKGEIIPPIAIRAQILSPLQNDQTFMGLDNNLP